MSLDPGVRTRLREQVDEAGWIEAPQRMGPYLSEQRGLFPGEAEAVLRPASPAAVSRILAVCHEARVGVVPQGGNTGLCGGANPARGQIVLALDRLDRIREVDAENFTLTAEAGCILARIQARAREADRFFPLSYAAEDRCQIGGNLSTNAGGMNVLKYGNARDLCLGLEVVLADGRIWSGLKTLRKDNSGLDLKDVFIGAEGTLGVITAATLKLFPKPTAQATAMIGLSGARAAVNMLGRLRATSADALTACELMARRPVEFALHHGEDCREPFPSAYPWYLLVDLSSSRPEDDLAGVLRRCLAGAVGDGLIQAYAVAASEREASALWRIRKSIPHAQRREGASIKHDISVPVSRIPDFLERATAAVEAELPGVRPCPFGHVGDGNIHFNLSQPPDMDADAFIARWDHFNRIVHDVVADMGGSFAAEHGVGKLKPAALSAYKSAVEIALMHALKQAWDPRGILNPGKLYPARETD
ncbi:FAD-binding oxidoreductase [Ectothiorhodospiraceae bacterium WFHF3C12]|nr:FAD-binding oxidoreductase [Ectothiorhodospiraceae bacterium WFHF3C12]